ncbi:MAG: hypothetical protein GY753_07540 [Gammaproteobacteria bacterium]|nr:hypothetical protein [Gammaproteobacteria bacterium]
MHRTRTFFTHAGLLGLLILTPQAQAEPADQAAAAQTTEDSAVEQAAEANKNIPPPEQGGEGSQEAADTRDLEARKKAQDIFQEMQKKLGPE